MKIKIIILAAIIAVVFSSCSTTPVCVTSSLSPLSGKVITENLGKCQGSDTAWSFLGLFMIGRPDIDMAIKDALSQKGGDTLINVRCYEVYRYYFLFGLNTVVVEGEAVRLGSMDTSSKGKGK